MSAVTGNPDVVLPAEGPEREIARDLARRAAGVSPAFIILGAALEGVDGAVSAGLALLLVAGNFLLGAAIIGRAVSVSLNALYGAVLLGYIVRLGLLAVIALAFKSTGWFSAVPFAITLLVTHLGLLAAETKRVSITLAHPGLAPSARKVGDEPSTDPTSPQE
ncbi:MAG: ATP synthase subunit I [Acidimicrobiales bacterium]|nr:ATP synthase subunit I [Acidimicrobiales bacterium]